MRSICTLAAGVASAALSSAAGAHEFACEKKVEGEVAHRVNKFPARLHFEITVRNVHPTDASTATSVKDELLDKLGFAFKPQVPFTLPVGGSATSKFEVTVKDRAECLKLAAAQSCSAERFDDVFRIGWESGEAQCRAVIVCGEAEDHHGDDGDDDDHDGDHDEHGKCDDRRGDDHGLAFWMSHTKAVKACAAAGEIDLGLVKVRTAEELEGILWADEARCHGSWRSKLDLFRLELMRELLVATCAVRVLHAKLQDDHDFDRARALIAGKSCHEMKKVHFKFEKDRDCGCHHGFDAGRKDSEEARRMAVDVTKPSGEACEGEHDHEGGDHDD